MRSAWVKLIPYLSLSGLFGIVAIATQLSYGEGWGQNLSFSEFGLLPRLMQAFYVLAISLWRALIPLHLSPVYSELIKFDPLSIKFIGSALAIVLISIMVIIYRRRRPGPSLLWLSYAGIMIPALGFATHPHFASDRYTYLGHTILAAALSFLIFSLLKYPTVRKCVVSVTTIFIIFCGILTTRQTRIWNNTETFSRYVLSEVTDTHYRVDQISWRLGLYYESQNRWNDAEAVYSSALREEPNSSKIQSAAKALKSRMEEAGVNTTK
jgi:hypothetical protein